MSDRTCTAPDCQKPEQSASYCSMHKARLSRNGSLEAKRSWRRRTGQCIIDGCTHTDNGGRGICVMHRERIRRHGDPHLELPSNQFKPREEHWNWVGEDALYRSAHCRVQRLRGKAADRACTDCRGQAAHWSYDHLDPDEKRSDDGLAYSLNVEHYHPRCVQCHADHDNRVPGPKRSRRK
jgi:hypothetical protein